MVSNTASTDCGDCPPCRRGRPGRRPGRSPSAAGSEPCSATDSVTPVGVPPASSVDDRRQRRVGHLVHAEHGQHQGDDAGIEHRRRPVRGSGRRISSAKAEPGVASEPAVRRRSPPGHVAAGRHRDHRPARGDRRLGDHGSHPRVVLVHHQRRAVFQHVEEARLGAQVVLGRAVEVEMLVGHEVGEGAEREA